MRRSKKIQLKKTRRTKRVRAKFSGTEKKPRLCIFRSNRDIYVQLIDDVSAKTVASASLKEVKETENEGMTAGVAKAYALGKIIGEKAIKVGVKAAVLDRGKFAYHGRVKALADGAREAGLKI